MVCETSRGTGRAKVLLSKFSYKVPFSLCSHRNLGTSSFEGLAVGGSPGSLFRLALQTEKHCQANLRTENTLY